MSLWNKFVELFDKDRQQQFIAMPLRSEQIDAKSEPVAIAAGKTYFRLRLSQDVPRKGGLGRQNMVPGRSLPSEI